MTPDVPGDWAERFARVRVLIVGDAMLDRYVRGSVDRISPEAPVPIFLAREEFDRLGGAANVAANIAALGGAADLVALVGRAPEADATHDEHDPKKTTGALDAVGGPRDPMGWTSTPPVQPPKTPGEFSRRADWAAARLALKCAGQGFRAHLLPLMDGTIVKTRLLAGQQQILRIDHEAAAVPYATAVGHGPARPERQLDKVELGTALGADGRRARAATLTPLLAEADVVLVSDYAKGMVDASLFEQLRASGKPVVIDPRPAHRALYHKAALVTPNRREAMELLGLDPRYPLTADRLARRLVDEFDGDMLLTLGDEGMLLATRDGAHTALPARSREVFDVTGAGDTVAAAMALGVGAGLPLAAAARIANAAAGVVVGHLGTASASVEETRAALA